MVNIACGSRAAQRLVPILRSVAPTDPRRIQRRAIRTALVLPRDRPLRVLGIESSADDSCCAIVTSDRRILTSQVVKQHHINAKYGGIHPLRAQEGHAVGVVSITWT